MRLRVPVLQARPGGPAERFADLVGRRHPIVVFLVAMVCGLALTAGLSVGLGELVEHVFGIGGAGERFDVWLASHRTPGRTEASLVGSIIAGGVVLPIVAGVIALLAAALRQWLIGAFVVFGLGVESASYRITTLAIHANRPHVHRLEGLPVNASYPSGHTAAAIAVYCGIALLRHIDVQERDRARARMDGGGRHRCVRRARAHVPRYAPSDRCCRKASSSASRRFSRACRGLSAAAAGAASE